MLVTEKIINDYGSNVEYMTIVQSMVDAIFVKTERMFRAKFHFYIFTFLIPFAAHFFFAKWTAFILLSVSAFSLVVLTIYEVV